MPSAPPAPDLQAPAVWRAVRVRYPFSDRSGVGPVDLELRPGERLLLLGPSGSGKSTLLQTLTGIIPHSVPAHVEGDIELGGEPVPRRKPYGWAHAVAQFFQDADQTLCGMRVEDEIAFALENRALPEATICAKVGEAMRRVGLPEEWRGRRTMTLSGGEKQLVALAATLAQEAPIFVADEPTAHLAPEAANRLHRLLLEQIPGQSILIVDHRLDGLIGSVDRVAVLGPEGMLVATGMPAQVFRHSRDTLDALGIWRPLASRLDAVLDRAGLAPAHPPLAVQDVLEHLDRLPASARKRAGDVLSSFAAEHMPPASSKGGDPIVRLVDAACAPFLGPTVLRGVNLDIAPREVLGMLGANGAGKSTLGASLAGLLKLRGGARHGPAGGVAFQRPENQFTTGSVRQEIAAALPGVHASQVDDALRSWDLEALAHHHPFELSQGQKRRLALATLAAGGRWPLLVLDEPLAGLDAAGSEMVTGHIEAMRDAGFAIVVITHDMDFALRLCPRSIVVGEGGILADGPTRELLADKGLLYRAGLCEPAIAPLLRWLERAAAC